MSKQKEYADDGVVAIVFIVVSTLLFAHIYTGYDYVVLQAISTLIICFWTYAALKGVHQYVTNSEIKFGELHWLISLLGWFIIGLILITLWSEFRFGFWVFASLIFVADFVFPISKKYFY